MYGISPKLPISEDSEGNLMNTRTLSESVQQNLKNIILTTPGERVMDVEFGVGLRNYLFLNDVPETTSKLDGAIRQQVSKYMPFVKITELDINSGDRESNLLQVSMRYEIEGLMSDELLFLSLKTNL